MPAVDDFWNVDSEEILHPREHAFEVVFDTFFISRHSVMMNGHRGDEHVHSYRIQIRCKSTNLDPENQMVVGFTHLREVIHEILAHYNNRLLNDLPPFRSLQPTTEALSGVLFHQLERILASNEIELMGVTLWESPDEGITYEKMA